MIGKKCRISFIALLLTIAVVSPSLFSYNEALSSSSKEFDQGDTLQIRLSWTGDPEHTMTVVWHTDSQDNPDTVQIGETTAFEMGNVTGKSFSSSFSGYLHRVDLKGLKSGSTYHYRVSRDNGTSDAWSARHNFTTAPPSDDESFSFIAAGDSRQAIPWGGNLDGWNNVVSRVDKQKDPSFFLFTGDLCYDGDTESYWNDWFDKAHPITSSMPFMSAIGNHETSDDPKGSHYLGEFSFPNNELWYSFNYSSAHVICLSTEHTDNATQRRWLEKDLKRTAEDPAHPWIIVYFHEPPYTSCQGGHGPDGDVQQNWVPLFDKYDVDFVFNGHNHIYQRTYPLYGGNDTTDPTITTWEKKVYQGLDTTMYIVTGAAGAPTIGYTPNNDSGYIAKNLGQTDHFVKTTIYGNNSVEFEVITAGGDLFERFWVVDEPPSSVTRSLSTGINGWNFISSSIIPQKKNISDIFNNPYNGIEGNYDKIMYYDRGLDRWRTYAPSRKESYDTLHRCNRSMGIWVHMTHNDTLTVKGKKPNITDISLKSGWNMVGYPSSKERTAYKTLPSTVTKIGVFNASREYNIQYIYDLSNYTMKQGEGYWVYNSADHEVTWTVEY